MSNEAKSCECNSKNVHVHFNINQGEHCVIDLKPKLQFFMKTKQKTINWIMHDIIDYCKKWNVKIASATQSIDIVHINTETKLRDLDCDCIKWCKFIFEVNGDNINEREIIVYNWLVKIAIDRIDDLNTGC